MDTVYHLQALVKAAMGENGFISATARKSQEIRQDAATAFDAYALLLHFLDKLPVNLAALTDSGALIKLSPAIHFDPDNNRVLAVIPIDVGELDALSYWCANNMPSGIIKQTPGLLALPFSLGIHKKTEVLVPAWCAAFFMSGKASLCVPILILRAVLLQDATANDWVNAALARLREFSLSVDVTEQAIQGILTDCAVCTADLPDACAEWNRCRGPGLG
jgi:hypothetical protein